MNISEEQAVQNVGYNIWKVGKKHNSSQHATIEH